MKKMFVIVTIVISLVSGAFAIDSYSCKNFHIAKGKKVCVYDNNSASKYALKYYNLIEKRDKEINNPFGIFSNNCTNFINQAILAGFVGSTRLNYVNACSTEYDTESNEPLQWYFREYGLTSDSSSSSWRGANSLFSYAKSSFSDLYKIKYNGLKFKLITRDYISSFDKNGKRRTNGGALEVQKVKVGDIVFIDYKDKKGNYSKQNKPLKDIKTDKIIDHVFIVTKINTSTKSYNRILVTGNTTTYANKGLGKINEDSLYKRKVEFYILRPVFYVEKP